MSKKMATFIISTVIVIAAVAAVGFMDTVTFHNKVLIDMLAVVIWGVISYLCLGIRYITLCVLAVFILTWNYMYNFMDSRRNFTFPIFQEDSESLVLGAIYAAQEGLSCSEESKNGYGLYRYYNLKDWIGGQKTYLSRDDWELGYSKTTAAIIVDSNIYSQSVAVPGNYILFENGEMFPIIDIEEDEYFTVINLLSDTVLTPDRYGSLDNVEFYTSDYQLLPAGGISPYESQYGLQGKFFRYLAVYLENGLTVEDLHLLCSIAAAIVFVMITLMIAAKYNKLMAGCFFVTFWLSPWIVNFARNLYWVEFTWFLPMATGLFCAWKIDSRKCRVFSYIAAFITIFVKCLCGYEYITTIMMGIIAFLLVDFVNAMIRKDKKKGILLIRTIVILGIMALLGFAGAICVHAPLKADGNILAGIIEIYEKDALRRTNTSDLNNFDEEFWISLQSSVWDVLFSYFMFHSDIIKGIIGDLFSLLCGLPFIIFVLDISKKKINYELLTMYIVFFLTTVSWYILAKAHSYVHHHMNYVLWYFGFVQICFYIIIDRCITMYKNRKKEVK